MRVLLFGASGGIGSQVRRLALAAGHELVLFARDPSALEPLASAERAIQGDIADADSVEQAVSGVDAVVSALGPSANSADQVALFEAFAQALVAAMQRHGARRLVTISGAAVDVPGSYRVGPLASGVTIGHASLVGLRSGHCRDELLGQRPVVRTGPVDGRSTLICQKDMVGPKVERPDVAVADGRLRPTHNGGC